MTFFCRIALTIFPTRDKKLEPLGSFFSRNPSGAGLTGRAPFGGPEHQNLPLFLPSSWRPPVLRHPRKSSEVAVRNLIAFLSLSRSVGRCSIEHDHCLAVGTLLFLVRSSPFLAPSCPGAPTEVA
jgi:hypothetical protein